MVYIILVNYNGAEDTIECVRSIKMSEMMDYHIVVVDNASTDDSIHRLVTIYDNDKKVTILESDKNLGFSGGNNLGIRLALEHQADAVLLLNNDTVVDKEFLNQLVMFDKKNKGPVFLTGKIMYYMEPSKVWYAGGGYSWYKGTTYHYMHNQQETLNDQVQKVQFACGCLTYINKAALDKVGLMPEEYFLYSEDLAYSLEARNNEIPIFYIPTCKIYHKVSSSTKKISELSSYYIIRNRFYIIKKYHHGIKKISANIFSCLSVFKRIKRGVYSGKIVKMAIHDCIHEKMGEKHLGRIE